MYMPQKVYCGECGEVFYKGNDLKIPEDFIKQLDGVCPKCGKKLVLNPENIDIQISKENTAGKR